MTWDLLLDPVPPLHGSAQGVSRLLRELARAGVASWREADGRLGLLAEEEPPAELVRVARLAAGDLLALSGLPCVRPRPREEVPAVTRPTPVDLETFGPLSDPGSERYVREAEIICACALVDGAFLALVPGAEEGPREFVVERADKGRTTVEIEYVRDPAAWAARVPGPWVAHNAAGFDARVWAARGNPPPPGGWLDSLPAARRLGLPGDLDSLGEALAGAGKRGRDALEEYTDQRRRLERSGGVIQATIFESNPVPVLDRVVAYCCRDVAVLAAVLSAGVAAEMRRGVEVGEHAVWEADQRVQARGFAVDIRLAAAIHNLDAALVEKRHGLAAAALDLGQEEARLTVSSPKRLRGWLAGKGHDLTNARRGTLEDLAEEADLDDETEAVLGARLAEARVHRKKLLTAIAEAEDGDGDGRIRRWGTYYAAHTGRWGGRRFQPQNLPRPELGAAWADALTAARRGDLAALEAAATRAEIDPSDALASLVRAVIAAPPGRWLVCADYAQVEARVALWMAGEVERLREFEAGDPYAAMAARIDGKPPPTEKADPRRRLGKEIVLGASFGLGAKRFAAHVAAKKIDLCGTTPERAVRAWREAHPRVVAFWAELEAAWGAAATAGKRSAVGPLLVEPAGDAVAVNLPSGRRIWYRRPKLEKRQGWDRWTFELARRGRVETWSGKLMENAVSATARDLLGRALVELDRVGLAVVLHVHDEVVVEVDEAGAEEAAGRVRGILEDTPAWARGLPIKAEVHVRETWG